ncbi:MAG: hypothetical protein K2K97_04710 [Muribaculaceae bacterium]|nr:hypothetical protein [Muribaculaceae bacterium]
MHKTKRAMAYAAAREELDGEWILRVYRIVHCGRGFDLFGQPASDIIAGTTLYNLTIPLGMVFG